MKYTVMLDGLERETFEYATYKEARAALLRLIDSAKEQTKEDGIERTVSMEMVP